MDTDSWSVREYFEKNIIKGHNLEAKTGGHPFLHISLKLHEDIMNSEWVMGCRRMQITQKHKTQSKGQHSEMEINRNCT